ncbi:nesprin-2 isoform X2 [Brienomyrus brachyistius]|uniref:nesprin-2 isoform X2 n=1 Tax=Brienomyrus brachyistius TaxID=42636 RepID=UPI0020B36C24|nr:nesprin-2 isoform X2 [Brienomyrus brachyistius]
MPSEVSTLEAELTADEGRLQAEIPKTEATVAFDTELTESVIEVADVDAMADRDMLQVDLPKSDSDVTEGQSRTQTVIKISEVCFTLQMDTMQDEIATAEVTVTSGSEVVEPEICRPSTESERVEFEIAKAEPEVTLDIVTLKPSIAKIEPDLRPDTDGLQTEQLKVKIDLSSDIDRVTPEKSETDTDVTPERETLLSDIPSPKADVVSGSKRKLSITGIQCFTIEDTDTAVTGIQRLKTEDTYTVLTGIQSVKIEETDTAVTGIAHLIIEDSETVITGIQSLKSEDTHIAVTGIHSLKIEDTDTADTGVRILQIEDTDTADTGVRILQTEDTNTAVTGIHSLKIEDTDTAVTGVRILQIEDTDAAVTGVRILQIEDTDTAVTGVRSLKTVDTDTVATGIQSLKTEDTDTAVTGTISSEKLDNEIAVKEKYLSYQQDSEMPKPDFTTYVEEVAREPRVEVHGESTETLQEVLLVSRNVHWPTTVQSVEHVESLSTATLLTDDPSVSISSQPRKTHAEQMDSDILPTQPLGTWTSIHSMTQHIISESADSDSSSLGPGLPQSRPWDLRHRVAHLSSLQPPDPDAQEDTGSGSSSLPTATLKTGHTKSQKGVNQGSSCVPQQWERRGGDLVTGPAEARSGVESGAESASQPTMTELLMDCLQLERQEASSSIKGRSPLWDAMVCIDTSPRNQENHLILSRVAFRILCCQNQPARISTTAMVQQVDEAKACQQCVLEKLDALPSAGIALETVHPTERQWKAILQDASAAVQMKEAQMQLVSQYEEKRQTAEGALAKLKVELKAACGDTTECMTLQEEQLRGFLQNLEQESSTMAAVLQVFPQVSPVLDEDDRTGTLIQLEDLQGHWWTLQRVAERALYHATAYVQESATLLREAQDLHKQLKALQASELFQSRSGNCASVQLVFFGATLAATEYQYDKLNQLFEALNQSLAGETERRDIRLALQSLKEGLDLVKTQLSEMSISVISDALSKIMKVMQDHLTWAKKMEIKITEKMRKLDLFPEKVHRQIFELKKLKCEIQSKQIQLESLVEDVKELTPVLDEKELPPLLSLVDTLKDLTKSAADNSVRALLDVKLSLQMKEKLFEQITNVDAWVAKHVEKEMTSWANQPDSEPGIASRLRHRMAELKEAEKHSAVIMTLLNKAGEMAPQLSLADRCKLHDLLIDHQGTIHGIITSERKGCRELEDLRQARVSSLETLASIEAGLRQIDLDLTKHKFPVTKDSLTILEHYRYLLLKHRWQVERLHHCKRDKRRELQRVMVDLQKKINSLGLQAEAHGKYLSSKKQMEDWRQNLEKQALQLKDEKISKVERFRSCHILSVQFSLTKNICQEVTNQLNNISQDLYPSQLNSERQKIRHTMQGLASWEMAIHNDLKILESALLEGKCYFAELHAMLEFLRDAQHKLDHALPVSPDEQAIDRELLWCLSIEKRAESGKRALEALKYRTGTRQDKLESKHSELTDLIEKVLKESHLRTGSLHQAKEALRVYSAAVCGAADFFQDAESQLLPVLSETSGCADELQCLTAASASLTQGFGHLLSRLQELLPLRTCLSVSQVEQIHMCVMSHLLVTLAMLQARAQLQHEALQSCTKRQNLYRKSLDDICHHVEHLEKSLSECVSHKVTSLQECSDLQEKLKALEQEAESHSRALRGTLTDLWLHCPKPGCGSKDEAEAVTLRRRLAGLHHSACDLRGCWERRAAEWKGIALSMEGAQKVREQLEDEIPPSPREGALQEELQNLLPDTEKYLESLNSELCVLASLEMRLPRTLGDPAKKEQATPSQFSQDLQAIRESYRKLTEKSMLGRQAASVELHDREKVREEIYGMRERLRVASCRLASLEHFACQSRLQEVRLELSSQRAVLRGIMEGLRVKYPSSFPLVPLEVQKPLQEVTHLLEELEEKLAETAEKISPVRRLGVGVTQVTGGLRLVMSLLEQKSSTVVEAEYLQKRVWDELDRWHTQLAALESEVADMSQDQPELAHNLMDQLTEPLQLYQKVVKQAEQRTAFLSKIPACLQEYEEIMASSNSWLREAKGWLNTPCSYTSARSLSSHVHALQVLLEDSEQMRATLQAFTPFLKEISTVCNTMALEQRLNQADEHVASMQQSIVGPLTQLQNTAAGVDAIEAEVKFMEKNVTKIRAILSSLDSESASPEEHLRDWQVILDNIQAMKRTITEIQNCKPSLGLPREAEEALDVFQRAQDLLPPIQDLEQETVTQIATIKISASYELKYMRKIRSIADDAVDPRGIICAVEGKVWETSLSEEEEEGSTHSSSSDTLIGSVSEGPDDTAEEPAFPAEGTMGAAGGGGAQHGDLVVGAACGGVDFGDGLNVGVLETPEPHLIPTTKSAIAWKEEDRFPEPIIKQIFDPHDKYMFRSSTPSSEILKDDHQAEVMGDVFGPPLSVSASLETDYDSQLSATIPRENVSVSQEALSLLYKRNLSLPEETKSVRQHTVSVPQRDVSAPAKTTSVTNDTASVPLCVVSISEETLSVILETVSVPKRDVPAPKETTSVTRDTASVPTRDVSAPKETVSAAKDMLSVPQKDDLASAEYKSVTQETVSVPDMNESAPKETTPVTQETVSVCQTDAVPLRADTSFTQETVSVHKKDVAATAETISVTHDALSVAKRDMSTSKKTISVTEEKMSVPNKDVTATKETILVTQETMSVPKRDVSTPKKTLSAIQETVSVLKMDVSAPKASASVTRETVSIHEKDVSDLTETISVALDTMSVLQKDMSTPAKTISETLETVSVPKRDVTATKETISVTQETVSIPKRHVKATKETVSSPQDTLSIPQKDVSATAKSISVAPDTMSVLQKDVSPLAETISETQETVSVPKRDVTATKETISVTQETVSIPKRDVSAPKETVSSPEEILSVPQKDVSARKETTSVTQDTVSIPKRDVSAPKETVSAPQEMLSVPQKDVSDPTETISVALDTMSVLQKDVSTPAETISETLETVSVPKRDVSATKETISVTQETVSAPKRDVKATKETISVTQETVSIPKRDVKATKETISVTQETVSAPKRDVSAPKETASAAQDTLSIPQKDVSAPAKSISVALDTMSVLQKDVSAPKETVSAPQEMLSIPQKDVSAHKETTSVTRDTVSIPEKDVSALAKSISAPQDTLSIPQEDVSTPTETMLETLETVSVPKRDVKATKETISVTQETVSAPKRDVSAPKETASAAQDTLSIPQKDVSAPAKSISVALDTMSVLQKDVSPPAETISETLETVSVHKRDVTATKETVSSPEEILSVPQKDVSAPAKSISETLETVSVLPKDVSTPAETISETLERVSVPKRDVSAPKETVSSSQEMLSVPQKDVSAPAKSISVALETMSVLQKDVSTPTETISETLETVSVPKRDVTATKETTSVTQETVSIPKRDVSAPKETVSAPQEMLSVPQKDVSARKETISVTRDTVSIPKRDVSAPKETVSAPQEMLSVPQKDVSACKETTSVTQDTVSIPKWDVSAPKETVSAPQEMLSVPQKDVSARKETKSVTQDTVSIPKSDVSAPKETVSAPQEMLSLPEKDVSASAKSISVALDTMSILQKDVSTPTETILETLETVSVPKRDVSAPKETVSAPQEMLSVPQKNVSARKETTSVTRDTVSIPKRDVSAPKETVSAPQEMLSVPQKDVSARKETTSVTRDTVSIPEKDVSALAKSISAPQDTLSIPQEDVSTPTETILETLETVSAPKRDVSAPKETASAAQDTLSIPQKDVSAPAKSISETLETVSVPKRDVSAPKETVSVTQETVSIPKRDVSAPKDTVSAPQEMLSVPQKDVSAPAKSISVALDTMSVLQKDVSPPAETISETLETVSVPKRDVTATKETTSVTQETVSIPKRDVSAPKETVSAPQEMLSVPQKDVSARKETISVTRDTVSIPKRDVSAPKETVSAPQEMLSVPQKDVSAPAKSISVALDTMSVLQKDVSPPAETISETLETVSVPKRDVTATKETTSVTQETVSIPKRDVSAPKETVSAPQEMLSVPQKDVSARKETISVTRDTVSIPKRDVSAPKETVSAPQEMLSLPEKDVSAPAKSISAPHDTLSIPQEDVSTPAETISETLETVSVPKRDVTATKETTSVTQETVSIPKRDVSAPKETVSAPQEMLSVPQKDVSARKETISVTRDTVSIPKRDVSAPKETVSAPQEMLSLPEKDVSAPAKSISAPHDTLSIPQEDVSTPAETISETLETVSVPKRDVTATKETISVTQETVSVPKRDVSAPKETVSAPQEMLSLPEKDVSAPAKSISVALDTMSVLQKDVSTPAKTISETLETVSVPKRDVSSPKETVSATQEKVSVPKRDVSARKVTVSAPQDTLSIPQEDVPTPTETILETLETVSVPKRDVKATKETISVTQETVSVPKRDVSAPKETISAIQETVSVPKRDVSAPKETTSVTQETVLIHQKDVSAPTEPMSVMHDALSVAKRDMSTSKETISVTEERMSFPMMDMSATKETISVTQETIPAPNETVRAPQEMLSVPQKDVSSRKETTPVIRDTVSVPKRDVSAPTKTTSITQETVSVRQNDVLAPTESISITHDALSTAKRDVSTPKETVSVTEETLSVPKRDVSATKETTPVTQDTASVPKRDVSAPNESTSVTQDTMSVAQKDLSAPVDNISVTRDTVSLPNRDVPATKDTPSATQDIVSVTKETTSITQETVSGPQGDVSSPAKTMSVTHHTLTLVKRDEFATKETISEPKETVSVPHKDASVPFQTVPLGQQSVGIPLEPLAVPPMHVPVSGGPWVEQGLQPLCDLTTQVRAWLESAHGSLSDMLPGAPMPGGIEEQLLTCQGACEEMEKNVSSLYSLSPQDLAETRRWIVTLLSALDQLKSSLLPLLQLSEHSCQIQSDLQCGVLVQEGGLEHTVSNPELLTTLKIQSIQQEKELQLELKEQRDLAVALQHYSSQGWLQRATQEHKAQLLTRSNTGAEGDATAQERRPQVHGQLEATLAALDGTGSTWQDVLASGNAGKPVTWSMPAILRREAIQLEDLLNTACTSLQSQQGALQEQLDQQLQYEQRLHGLASLVELGWERLTRSQHVQLRSQDELQGLLSSHKTFFQKLASHLAMVQRLSQRLSATGLQTQAGAQTEAQAEAQAALEQDARTLQQRAVQQGVRLQDGLQAWSQWQESCGWIAKLLHDLEARMPSSTGPGHEDQEEQLQQTLCVCEQVSKALEESRAPLGAAVEQGQALQAGGFGSTVGAALRELQSRWNAVHHCAEREQLRVSAFTHLWARFCSDSVALGDWLGRARERLESWRRRCDATPPQQEHVRQRLANFLDFTKEVEARSSLKASVISTGEQLLQLKRCGDAGTLREQLTQLEQGWAEILSTLPSVQDWLHQQLMEKLHPSEAMTELGVWMDAMEKRLKEDHQEIRQASSAAGLQPLLQRYKEYQVEMACHQLTVDTLDQSVSQPSGIDLPATRYELALHAEKLGALNLRWLRLKGALCSQVQLLEQNLQTCLARDERLRVLGGGLSRQREKLSQVERPSSRSQAREALQECGDTEEKLKDTEAQLQELREVCLSDTDGELRRHCTCSEQLDMLRRDCADLRQQVTALRPRLQGALDLWGLVTKGLAEIALHTTKSQYSLEQGTHAQFSQHALQDHVDELQLLQVEAGGAEEKWEALNQNFSNLRDVISPAAAQLLSEQIEKQKIRWAAVSQEVAGALPRAQELLGLWRRFSGAFMSCSQSLQVHQERASFLLAAWPGRQHTAEQVVKRLEASRMQQQSLQVLQRSMEEVMETSKHLTGHMNVPASIFIQSEGWMLSCELLKLREALARREGHLQEELQELQKFTSSLASLELHLCSCQSRLTSGADSAPQSVLQDLGSLGPELEALNWKGDMLPQGDPAGDRLQALNRQWSVTFSQAAQVYSELQQGAVGQQSFQLLCQGWEAFLQSMEDSLARQEPLCSPSLREQLAVLQKLRVELPRGDQLLWSVLREGQGLLESLEAEQRHDLALQLTHMREHWHSVLVRVQQHGALLRALVRYWQLYIHGTNELRALLSQTDTLLPPTGPAHCSLRELRWSLHDLKYAEDQVGHRRAVYRQTMQIGWQLCSASDAQTQAQLQTELRLLQEDWERTESLLEKRRALTEAVLQNWERYKARLADSGERLEEVRNRLKQPLPECLEEIRVTEKITKEQEEALQHWAHDLTELAAMKTELSQYVTGKDGGPPDEAAEDLQLQWEELCAKVSLRKQEIADRLSAWVIFNKKNRELCEWLTQMESKVTHRADISLDDMMEKLKKDFMEEINLFSENKIHLNRLAEQLLSASDQAQGAEASDRMADVNARWQCLLDHIEARVRKLKETRSTVRQLDMDMNPLRVWLCRTEATLATPVTYSICHQDEIQGKLAEQQDLQRDVEQHAESVASMLTVCEGLLGDSEGCGTETERKSLQETARCLEQRWRNICTRALERRARIDGTWQLWCSFLDDHSHFDSWLKAAEHTAANPESANVPYASAKEELKKFEAFQRQVQERLAQLERLNKQYCQLAREHRTDSADRLRHMAWEVNRRWDELESRVAAILRRLRHFTSQREEFEGMREGLLVWLTEMDLQLTTVEHFSESDVQDKMRQLNDFQQEITLNTSKIDQLIVFGENLIQKSAAPDAVAIEDELEELHSYCQEVFGRVGRFHQRLTSLQQVVQEQQHQQEDLEEEARPARGGGLLSISQERSDRDTPVSVESIPLEWDHAVDVGPHQRKGEEEEEEEEEATFYSALSGRSETEASWHSPEHTETGGPYPDVIHTQASGPLDTSVPLKEGYVDLMLECSGTVASVERVSLILNSPEHPDDVGLTGISAADKQSGVIKRWELLQAQARGVELEAGRDLRGQQLTSDLEGVAAWLGQVQCELERLKSKPSASVQDMEAHVRQLKEMQHSFASYKTMIISANLRARELQQSEAVAARDLQGALCSVNQGWKEACAGLEAWEEDLRSALLWCQEFHTTLHSLLLWLAHAESRRFAVDMQDPSLSQAALLEQQANLRGLEAELLSRQQQVESLQEISSQLLPEAAMAEEEYAEAREKVHVVGRKLHTLLQLVDGDLHVLQERLVSCPPPESAADVVPGEQGEVQEVKLAAEGTPPEATRRQAREQSPPRSFFQRVLRATFPLHVLFLLLLVLACLVYPFPQLRSFHPMLHYTNGPPPT